MVGQSFMHQRHCSLLHREGNGAWHAALAVLRPLHEARVGEFVFVGNRRNAPISNATMTKALITAGGKDFTVHGFRSAFRDWVGEETSFPDALAEAALAHIVGDETVRAYRRGDALTKRRELMEAWATHCIIGAKAFSSN